MKCLIVLCSILAFLAPTTGAVAAETPVDLSSWTEYTLNLPGGQSSGNWVLSDGNITVTQKINADPSYYLDSEDRIEYTINGTWQVVQTADDDFIGFTFGYQDAAHCYIMDWKQGDQSSPYNFALEGFSIKKFEASDIGDLVHEDFWLSPGTVNTTILASNWGSGLGWEDNTRYTFNLDFSPGQFTITVFEGETVLWDVTVNDATFGSGKFGFYNSSQANVQYSGFVINEPPVCDAGGPYYGDAGVPVQFDASGSIDPDGEIVAYEWDFGDGQSGTGVAPTHTYAADGEYNITLCVTDNQGETRCCSPEGPAVPTEKTTWGGLKSLYR